MFFRLSALLTKVSNFKELSKMNYKKKFLKIIGVSLFVTVFAVIQVFAQPSDAQLKKQLTNPKTVSVTLTGAGTREWSSTYKKYIWTRYFTVKLKTDTSGEVLVVKGYAAYDIVGGRYIFWRTFTSGNSYEGKKPPTVTEINQALETAELRDFNYNGNVIGEYESMKISDEPDWEWHTPDSVSFNVVAVFNLTGKGRYGREAWYTPPPGSKAVDRVEAVLRIRLYRDGAKLPWRGVHVSDRIPTSAGANTIAERIKLIERKEYPEAQFRQMPKMSVIPKLTQ
jgi:hypothetical protein